MTSIETWTLGEVRRVLDQLWPVSGAESWDAPGLVVGSLDHPVTHLRFVVDVVSSTVDEALRDGVDLLVAHHPLLLRGVTSVSEEFFKGHLVASLIRGGCALLSAHTNADVVETGTSRVLATRLGLVNQQVIVPQENPERGLGIVGSLAQALSLYDFASLVGRVLPPTARGITVSGDPEQMISRVALCAGAGDSLLGHPLVQAADCYLTSDLRHHPASETAEARIHGSGPALVDVSHFAAEWLWLAQAAEEVAERLPGVTVSVSDLSTDPWDFVIMPGRHS